MSDLASNDKLYFLSNTFHMVDSDLTTDDEPIRIGGSVHHSVLDKKYDIHYEMELGIVLSGSLTRNSGEHTEILHAGNVWLQTIWEPHGYHIKEVPSESLVIIFRPELLFNLKLVNQSIEWFSMFYTKPAFRPQTNDKNCSVILEIAAMIKKTESKNLRISVQLLQTYLLQILIYLSQNWQNENIAASMNSNRIIRIQPAIQLAFSSEMFIPEKQAAAVCNLSISSFRKEFQDIMNVSFPRFTLRFRLRQSALMLLQTSMQIKEIAFKFGFFDLSHFYRDFKIHFGVTPKDYRNSNLLPIGILP